MSASLVGSEMCIRDSLQPFARKGSVMQHPRTGNATEGQQLCSLTFPAWPRWRNWGGTGARQANEEVRRHALAIAWPDTQQLREDAAQVDETGTTAQE
eukprot:4797142-Alexandrium_andersonii.AAC.1